MKNDSKQNGIAWFAIIVALLLFVNRTKIKSARTSVNGFLVIASISFFTSQLSAQTNVISLKSHAGEMAYLEQENDNFGAVYTPPLRAQVDTVKFIRPGVIVEYRQALHQSQYPITMGKNVKRQEIDTIRDPYYKQNLTPVLKSLYPSTTVFIGFKQDRTDAAKPYFDSIHKNGVSIWAIVILLLILNYKKNRLLVSSIFKTMPLLLLGVISSTTLFAQTNVISLKSHTGVLAQLHEEKDNFGGIYEPPVINPVQTVKFIRPGVIVEYRESRLQSQYPITNDKNVVQQQIDTLKSLYYTRNLTSEFKQRYPATTIFVGFNREHSDTAKPYFDSIHKNGLSIWAIVILLLILNYKKNRLLFSSIFRIMPLLLLGILSSTSLLAQTNVISLKSHAGEMIAIHSEKDNFGNPPESRHPEFLLRETPIYPLETVEFYQKGKIIHRYTNRMGTLITDTITDKNITQELTPYLSNKYSANTQFIGFKLQTLEGAKPYFDSIHKNGLSIWAIILIGLVAFSFSAHKKIS